MPKITLHHIEGPSRSERAFWLLEELNETYDVRTYLRQPTLMKAAPKDLYKHSLFGKGPAIEIDGASSGESAYVVHRLLADPTVGVEAKAKGVVESTPSEDSIFWCGAAEAAGMLWFQMQAMVAAGGRAWSAGTVGDASEAGKEEISKFATWYAKEICQPQGQNFLDQVESYLARHPGMNFSGNEKLGEGDFMMFFPIRSVFVGSRKDLGYVKGPATTAWWNRVSVRPAVAAGMRRMQEEEAAAKRSL